MAGIIKKLKKAKVGRKIQNTSSKVGVVSKKIDRVLDNPVIKTVAFSNPYTAGAYLGARAGLAGTQVLASNVNKGAKFGRSTEGKMLLSKAEPVIESGIQKAKPMVKKATKTLVKFV